MIAAAAAERAKQRPRVPEGGDAVVISVPEEGGQATGVAPSPAPCRGKTRRVAKAVTSRGVRLRNRVIQMRALFWNIRGFGHVGRRTQLKEYMRKEDIDIVGLQETIKANFRFHELLAIDPLERFEWQHAPAVGHSGGMLLGLS